MNKVILMGRLTADPNLNQTQSGISSCRFTVAVNRQFVNKQTGERQADFISCIAWRQTAEFICRYFKKGSMICVEGTLRTGSYQDRNHPDITHYTTDVQVDNVEFCGSKSESGNSSYSAPQNNNYGNGNNNNSYQASPQQSAPQPAVPNNDVMSYGNLNDFEEILSDGDVPF
ncbi:MAG: single-stranded DNA-binding protein [Ruminococcus flavefaciens]|nr:single-stranded DNA-binding protein [Ruminococcus flavefaciens]MCM1229643.1 single-stranded DNA-binding protein [Ruminococcus flavefaciens]